ADGRSFSSGARGRSVLSGGAGDSHRTARGVKAWRHPNFSGGFFRLDREVHGFRGDVDVVALADALEHFRVNKIAGAAPFLGVNHVAHAQADPVRSYLKEYIRLQLEG